MRRTSARRYREGRNTSEPADQASVPHPRLGFYGVIDERIDLRILDRMAEAHRMADHAGRTSRQDRSGTLPRRPNIHYFGQRSYDELPRYLAGWDVCLLPFARTTPPSSSVPPRRWSIWQRSFPS